MRKLIKTFCIFALSASSIAYAEIKDSPVDNKSTYHINDKIELISAHDIQYEKPKIMIKMVYPKLSGDDSDQEAVKKIVDNDDGSDENKIAQEISPRSSVNAFNEEVTKVITEEINYFKQRVGEAQDYQQTLDKSKVKNRLTIDYNSAVMNLEDQPIISIRFVMQAYVTGMAHPYRRYRTVNFDLDAGAPIELSQLFDPSSNYLETLANVANANLSKKIRVDAMLAGGAAPTPDNYRNWNINPNGLRITFDEATVAPYVYGSQSVLIPYSELKSLINPESALGRCLEHRKRCMRDPLLTGGFIDEAANTKHRRLYPVLG